MMDNKDQFTMSMIKDCGGIEQDADQIWYIPTNKNYLYVAKNREGLSNIYISLEFDSDPTPHFQSYVYNHAPNKSYFKSIRELYGIDKKNHDKDDDSQCYGRGIVPIIKL